MGAWSEGVQLLGGQWNGAGAVAGAAIGGRSLPGSGSGGFSVRSYTAPTAPGAELLPEHCEFCVGLNCAPGESVAALLGHLLDFVRDHVEQCLTVLAALPIVGRLSDFSIGAARRRCCPRRKVIVMSSPEEGTRRADGRGPYNERVMDKVAELQQRGRLKMGFDRAGTSTEHPADGPEARRAAGRAPVDWADAE